MPFKKYIKIVVSDCHLGAGTHLSDGAINPLEDFRKDDKFVEFLEFYSSGEYEGAGVELVINGDFFDMLQTRASNFPYEILETVAVHKIKLILRGHPKVIKALQRFIAKGHHVKMIWGNHDAGLWWPGVQKEILNTISNRIDICLSEYEFDGVRIEHGHQYEIMHQFDTTHMFFQSKGRTVLNYPFGSFFVAGFLTRLKLRRNYITQVVPFSKFLRWGVIFDFWFTVIQGVRSMWFFFKMRFIFHPLRFARFTKTLSIMHELFRRPLFHRIAPGIIEKHKAQILIMGHNHQATHRIYQNGTQYVNTGTWTDVTSFDPGSLGRLSRPTYAYIEYPEGVTPGKGVLPNVSLRVWRGLHHPWEDFEP